MKELLHENDIREDGIEIGKKIGEKYGERNRDKELIKAWIKKGKSISEIAEDLGRTEEYVRELTEE